MHHNIIEQAIHNLESQYRLYVFYALILCNLYYITYIVNIRKLLSFRACPVNDLGSGKLRGRLSVAFVLQIKQYFDLLNV